MINIHSVLLTILIQSNKYLIDVWVHFKQI